MIIVDFSQIAYACILDFLATTKKTGESAIMTPEIARHIILNTLRSHIKKFKKDYGEVIVAFDSKHYWRKGLFPHYKHRRKSDRQKSQFNWESIFSCMDVLKKELQEHLLYKVIEVDGCEADDIIGYLCHAHAATTKILIISGDKDFAQLQIYPNVQQFSPALKKLLNEPFPQAALKQHIIRGDVGDGIPNILSPDDVFVVGGRQKPIMEKKLVDWINTPAEIFCSNETMLRNFLRNEALIDLKHIPAEYKAKIMHAYETAVPNGRGKFLQYLISSGLKSLTESVQDF